LEADAPRTGTKRKKYNKEKNKKKKQTTVVQRPHSSGLGVGIKKYK
jgi:hypothetical protein